MKTIIAGGRDFSDYALLRQSLINENITTILSGGARGADTLGQRYAFERGIPLQYFPANWALYGKGAGPRRNLEMAQRAEALVAFWDGKSPGTSHMISSAKAYGLKIKIICYD